MRKFTTYINEAEETNIDTELKDELKNMISKSLKTSDSKTIEDFIDAYKSDSETNQIKGLINDSELYDFYLKYGEEIDEMLSKTDFFKKAPDSMNIYSLYDIIIAGTKEAVKRAVNGLSNG